MTKRITSLTGLTGFPDADEGDGLWPMPNLAANNTVPPQDLVCLHAHGLKYMKSF